MLGGAEANKDNALRLSNLDAIVSNYLTTLLFHLVQAMKSFEYFGSMLWTYLTALGARLNISK